MQTHMRWICERTAENPLRTSCSRYRKPWHRNRLILKTHITVFVLFTLALAPSAALGQLQTKNSGNEVPSRERAVKAVLAQLVYAVRSALPELVMSQYAKEGDGKSLQVGVSGPKKNELAKFFRDYQAPRGRPLIYISDPKVTWNNDEAMVKCAVVWNLEDQQKRLLTVCTNEEFIVAWREGRYRISSSRTTPLVMRYLPNVKVLEREIRKSERGKGDRRPSLP